MPNWASNVKLSSPIAVHVRPDVDLNGFMWSSTIGLMFPPQAAAGIPMVLPRPLAGPPNQIGKVR